MGHEPERAKKKKSLRRPHQRLLLRTGGKKRPFRSFLFLSCPVLFFSCPSPPGREEKNSVTQRSIDALRKRGVECRCCCDLVVHGLPVASGRRTVYPAFFFSRGFARFPFSAKRRRGRKKASVFGNGLRNGASPVPGKGTGGSVRNRDDSELWGSAEWHILIDG